MVPLVDALRRTSIGARMIALDWRGHGDSGWIGPGGYYHFVDYVADLAVLMETVVPALSPGATGHSLRSLHGWQRQRALRRHLP